MTFTNALAKVSACGQNSRMLDTPPLILPTAFRPGIYDLAIEAYLADRTSISSSGLKRILRSPLDLQRYLQRQHISSPMLDFGTAAHCALLEPERFATEYIALPVQHTDLFHPADLQLIEEAGHRKLFITQAQMDAIHGIRDQLAKRTEIVELLKQGKAEQSLFWRDEETQIRCKIRPDLLVLPHVILELKTTFNASLDVFQRTLQMQHYHLSAAMYLAGVRQLTGHTPNYVFLVACREPPYQVETYVPSKEMLQAGARLFREALNKLKAEKVLSASYV